MANPRQPTRCEHYLPFTERVWTSFVLGFPHQQKGACWRGIRSTKCLLFRRGKKGREQIALWIFFIAILYSCFTARYPQLEELSFYRPPRDVIPQGSFMKTKLVPYILRVLLSPPPNGRNSPALHSASQTNGPGIVGRYSKFCTKAALAVPLEFSKVNLEKKGMRTRLITSVMCALSVLMVHSPMPAFASADWDVAPIVVDVAVARPLTFALTIFGTAVFVVSLPVVLPSGGLKEVARMLVVVPAKDTFTRPIGDLEEFLED